MLRIMRRFFEGVAAGILIAIGGCVYLATGSNWIGAVMFSVALLCICYKDYSLFTGRVGFITRQHTKTDFSVLFLGLFGNIAGAASGAVLVLLSSPNLNSTASYLARAKLDLPWYQVLAKAFLCGILMYLAVSIFKRNKTPIGIIFCIPTFILCGFEHSIADVFYLMAGMESESRYFVYSAVFILLVIIGNALGAMFIALFDKKQKEVDEECKTEKSE